MKKAVADTGGLLFRVEGNQRIGLGHMMRCLSIADAARRAGYRCGFVTAESTAAMVRERGYEAEMPYDGLRGEPWSVAEAEELGDLLRERSADYLLVDSYEVTSAYLETLHHLCRTVGTVLIYLDDILSFPYSCDVLINYNIYAPERERDYRELYERADGGRIALPRLLLGAEYVPLRGEFGTQRERQPRPRGRDILVSTGGADAEHMGWALLMAIAGEERARDYVFHLIIGRMNQDAAKLREMAEGLPNVRLYVDIRDMAERMRACDAAISAAGSTLYELCATQTPALTYILAENQRAGAEGFAARGVMRCCGDVRELGAAALAQRLVEGAIALCEEDGERTRIAQRMREVTDGRGAERLLQVLLER